MFSLDYFELCNYVAYIFIKIEEKSLLKMYLPGKCKLYFRNNFTPLWNCACFEFPGTEAISHYRVPFAKKIGLITIRKHQGIFILCSQASQVHNGIKTFYEVEFSPLYMHHISVNYCVHFFHLDLKELTQTLPKIDWVVVDALDFTGSYSMKGFASDLLGAAVWRIFFLVH